MNFFGFGPEPEDEDFDNRILKKCQMEFSEEHPKPKLKDFKRRSKIGKGTSTIRDWRWHQCYQYKPQRADSSNADNVLNVARYMILY